MRGSSPRKVLLGEREGRMADCQIFEAGNVVLQSGLTYRNARLAYKTYGTLNADKSNVIVYPTSYGAQHHRSRMADRPGARRSTRRKYFIVIMNKFGNGLSSSPEQHAAAVRPRRATRISR